MAAATGAAAVDDDDVWVYHEKQDSQLCGQHALNALLQGPFFTAPDLAEIAAGLDAQERELMLAAGADTDDAIRFAAEDSGNVNDGGFFSIEVLRQACKRFGDLSLLSATSEEIAARDTNNNGGTHQADAAAAPLPDLTQEQGFLCNRAEHWFAIRKVHEHFVNLNSTLDRPEAVGTFYLDAFLAQLRECGFSVFVVRGAALPAQGYPEPEDLAAGGLCRSGGGGRWFSLKKIVEGGNGNGGDGGNGSGDGGGLGGVKDVWARLTGGKALGVGGKREREEEDDDDDDIARAIALSLQQQGGGGGGMPGGEDDDDDIARAIALSLQKSEGGNK